MELVTPRTTMIKYNESDFEAFCEVVCNDEVMLNISGKGHSEKEAKKKFVALLITNQESVYYGVYKVCLLKTDKAIGFAKIVPFENDEMEIGYALLPMYWRKGLTIEMIQKMISHCRNYLPDKKIIAIVNDDNRGSLEILNKFNFKVYKKRVFKRVKCLFLKYTEH